MSEFDTSLDLSRDDVEVNPRTLNLHDLVLTMAMAGHGWGSIVNLGGEGRVAVTLRSNNRRDQPYHPGDETVFVEELGLAQDEEGTLTDGYQVTCDEGKIEIGFQGVPDERFSQTMQRLFDFSEQLGR